MQPAFSVEAPAPAQSRLGQFFYAREVPYGAALVRIFLPLSLLIALIPRWPHAREMFSTDGAATPLWETYGYAFTDMLPVPSGALAVALFTALIFFLITASIGWCSRISLAASFLLYTYFNLIDAVSTMTKYSVIASHVLLLLSLSPCGRVWSVDARLSRRSRRSWWPGEPAIHRQKHEIWPQRLLQLLIGFVYFGSAITKMKTPAFFSGDQLQTWMLTNVNFSNPVGEHLAMHPALLVVFAYVTVIWEVLFLFLVWRRGPGRAAMLGLGALFHIFTIFTLGLYIFPAVCISTYCVFLEERDIQSIARRWRRWKRALGWKPSRLRAAASRSAGWLGGFRLPAQAVLGLCAALVMLAGVEAEYKRDPYGLRRPEGPYTLRELDAEFVESRLLAPPSRVRPEDAVSFFETGTTFVGGMLVDKRRSFRHGETLAVQCTLNPPHEDMWMECKLLDAEGHVIDRTGQIVAREMLRANFYYYMNPALEPGRYELVLACAGRDILKREIVLKPARVKAREAAYQAAVAN